MDEGDRGTAKRRGERTGRGRRAFLALTAGALATLSGCSGEGDGTTGTTTGEATPSTPAPTTGSSGTTPTTATDPTGTTPATTAAPSVGLSVEAPEPTLRDDPVRVRVEAPSAGDRVRVRMTATDAEGNEWTAAGTYEAGADGVVDLAENPPVDGPYDEAHPMGLVWAMDRDDPNYFPPPRTGTRPLRVAAAPAGDEAGDPTTAADGSGDPATGTGGAAAGATVTVHETHPGVERRVLEGPAVYGGHYEPPGEGPHPAALTLHGNRPRPWEPPAKFLANHGYSALALQYYGTGDLPSQLERVPVEYAVGAVDWLLGRPSVRAGSVGLVGISRGSELALLVATMEDRVDAAASVSGSGLVWRSLPPDERPSWTVDGAGVPYVSYPGDGGNVEYTDEGPSYRRVYANGLASASASEVKAATVPVEEASAAYLFTWGTDDAAWPAGRLSRYALDRLDSAGYDRPYEGVGYENAGHGPQWPYVPSVDPPRTRHFALGGEPIANARAGEDIARRVRSLFDAELIG